MTSDPRPLLGQALDQSERLVRGTRADQLTAATPCAEFDVRALLGHTVGALRRIAHVGRGGDVFDIPHVISDVDDWADAFTRARADIDTVWSDDALLDTKFAVPWSAAALGRDTLMVWTEELITHAWDLAHATGRIGELDPELGRIALDIAHRYVPAEARGGKVPFAPAVPTAADSDPYTRLAAYLGRDV